MSSKKLKLKILKEPMTPLRKLSKSKEVSFLASTSNQSPGGKKAKSRMVINIPKLDLGLIKVKKAPKGLRNIYSTEDTELILHETEMTNSQRDSYPKSILKNSILRMNNSMKNNRRRSINISGYMKSVTFRDEPLQRATIKLEEIKQKEKLPQLKPYKDEKAKAKCRCVIY